MIQFEDWADTGEEYDEFSIQSEIAANAPPPPDLSDSVPVHERVALRATRRVPSPDPADIRPSVAIWLVGGRGPGW